MRHFVERWIRSPWTSLFPLAATAALAVMLGGSLPLITAPAWAGESEFANPHTSTDPHGRSVVLDRRVRLTQDTHNVVRTGPGEEFAIVGVFGAHQTFAVIAKRGQWYNIRVSDDQTGWVHASLCEEYDDLSSLEFAPNPRLYSRTGTFLLSVYGGGYAFDRKSNSFVVGGRLGYHLLSFLEADGSVAWTHVERPEEIVESLFGLSLEDEAFHMVYYDLNLTVEVLPGRQMVPFVTGGVGSTILQGKTESSVNVGAGTMLYLSRRHAMRWEVRNHRFKTGSDGARRQNSNIEFSLGTSLLF